MFTTFSIFQLIKNYAHIGHPSPRVNINSLFYMLGKYYNVSIIDIDKSLFLLKNYFFLLSNIIIKGGYVFLVWNDLKYKKYSNRISFCHYMYKWVPGTVTNFREIRKKNRKTEEVNIKFPHFVINFGINTSILAQEGRKLPVPFLSIVDTLHNITNFNFFAIYNTKSNYSSFFLYNVFLKFLEKMVSVKKSFFLNIFKKRLVAVSGTKKKK